jgi:uncharacterized Tic20 family protein
MGDEFQENPPPSYREARSSPMRDANELNWDQRNDEQPAKRRRTGYYKPTQDECSSAMMCHLLAIFFHFLGPLIMWLVKKDESRYCDYHGREALNFSLTLFIFNLIAATIIGVITVVTCGFGAVFFPLLLGIGIYGLVMHIIALSAANRGEWYRYPMTFRMISLPVGLESSPPAVGDYDDANDGVDNGAAGPREGQKKASLMWVWILCGGIVFLLLAGGCITGLVVYSLQSNRTATIMPPVAVVNPAPPRSQRAPSNPAGPANNGRMKPQNNGQLPPGADIPDVAADPVGKALEDLQSTDKFKQSRAADSLARQTPEAARHDEVVNALEKLTHESDVFLRDSAYRGLVVWASTKSDVPLLIEMLKSAGFVEKRRVIETLTKLKDPKAIKPLVDAIQDLAVRGSAEKALIAFGADAEGDVASMLTDKSFPVRLSACKILKEIGTKKSLPALETAAADVSVAKPVQDAIAAIKARNP